MAIRSLALGALLCAAALAFAGCGEEASAEEEATAAIEDFLTALRDRDAPGTCELLAEPTLEDLGGTGLCERVMGEAMSLLEERDIEIPDYEIASVSVTGDTADATLGSNATDGTVPLVKEGDEWLLLGTTALAQIHPEAPLESDSGIGEVDEG